MIDSHRRYFLKGKDKKRVLSDFSKTFKVDITEVLGSKPRIELAKGKTGEIIIINGRPLLAKFNCSFFPTLTFHEVFPFLAKIAVDMGAVSHICNGADVMAPGIVRIDGDFYKNDLLIVEDERHRKPLAIGVALLDSRDVGGLVRGKVVKNVHYVGDDTWNFIKSLI